mmetsp:Transcript_23088/g.46309  ORF Transcript_23088/g.46309 Transcript_23088/m.46309 type:complete len:443 (-) Transcript_23088:209-1537(-)
MSNWNMRHWVTASMAAIGTVATFKIMLEYRNWRRDSRQKKARRAERKRRREDPNRLAQKGLPTDAQLREATFMSIQNADRSVSLKGEDQLLAWLRAVEMADINAYSPKTRLLCATWLELYTKHRKFRAKSPEAFKAITEVNKHDLEIAWKLLENCRPEGENEIMAVRLLALRIAKRLKDHLRMVPIFDGIIGRLEREEDVHMREVLEAFIAAPYLGRWTATRLLGGYFVKKGGRLEDFHKVVEHPTDEPDMKILFELAQSKIEGLSDQDLPMEDIRWTEYVIKTLRIKVESVECDDEAEKKKAEQKFQSKIKWKEVKMPSETKILRLGAITQMLSFSMYPIPMVGPATETKMIVRGYANTTEGMRSEEINMENRDPNSKLWQGQYVCVEGKPPVTLRINIEMTLEELKSPQPESEEVEGKLQSKGELTHRRDSKSDPKPNES